MKKAAGFAMGQTSEGERAVARLKRLAGHSYRRVVCGRTRPCPMELGILRNTRCDTIWINEASGRLGMPVNFPVPEWENAWTIEPPSDSTGYGGYADTGFTILSTRKSKRTGQPVGRRDNLRYRDEAPDNPFFDEARALPRRVSGQSPALPCLIVCRCGTVNLVSPPTREIRTGICYTVS